jgi:hypothetical protein
VVTRKDRGGERVRYHRDAVQSTRRANSRHIVPGNMFVATRLRASAGSVASCRLPPESSREAVFIGSEPPKRQGWRRRLHHIDQQHPAAPCRPSMLGAHSGRPSSGQARLKSDIAPAAS